jgi:hypothetical protein
MTSQDSQNEIEVVQQWMRDYGINRFVTAQNRAELIGVPQECIWSEYFSYDDDNSYAYDSLAPDSDDDETLLGFYIGEQAHNSTGEMAIMTEKAIPCANPSCWSGDCATCGSTRVNGQINLYERALASKVASANVADTGGQSQAFCTECGKILKSGAKFCGSCGTAA